MKANPNAPPPPKALTKAALEAEAQARDALRKEFLAMQEAVKNTEIAVPFVFFDGTSIPAGSVKMKKGDYIWLFLDRCRKVGAEMGVGGANGASKARKEWARISVDDLMLVKGDVIVPHVSFPTDIALLSLCNSHMNSTTSSTISSPTESQVSLGLAACCSTIRTSLNQQSQTRMIPSFAPVIAS